MTTRLPKLAEQLLLLADRIGNAAELTNEHAESADRLLWAAYEAGAFPGDELFSFAVERHLHCAAEAGDKLDCRGFSEHLIHYWLRVRTPGIQCSCETGYDDLAFAFGRAVREIARMLLASVAKDTWEVGTPREFAKFVGMTDQQFLNWRKANLTCWERIGGSKKIRCSRTALDRLRNT